MTENENINALRDLAEQANGMIHWEINSDGARVIYETVISTLDLINRQKMKVVELEDRLDWAEADYNAVDLKRIKAEEELEKAKAEIERLKCITTNNPYCVRIGTADIFTANHEEYEWLLARVSAEAIKEFAERLNDKAFHDMNDGEAIVCCCDIDNLVKEMVGDTE